MVFSAVDVIGKTKPQSSLLGRRMGSADSAQMLLSLRDSDDDIDDDESVHSMHSGISGSLLPSSLKRILDN
jgi:hypothetical protein